MSLLSNEITSQRSQDLNQIKVFKNILNEVGVILSLGDEQHILTQEQALVVRDLEKLLENSSDRIEEFVHGLKALCKKQKYFRKALLLTVLRKNDNETINYQNEKIEQESLFRYAELKLFLTSFYCYNFQDLVKSCKSSRKSY